MPMKRSGVAALALLALAATPALAEDAAAFYERSKQVTIFVGFGPGSGYDNWARLVARHITRHIPGAPSVIVKNMPGAGSLVVANYLFNVAPKDGASLGTFSRNLPSQALMGGKGVKFDPRAFGWVGSPNISSRVCAVMAKSGVRGFEDTLAREVPMGGTGPASAPSFVPKLLNAVLGSKFKVIDGYTGAADIRLAMERGEVSGVCQSLDTIRNLDPEWTRAGTIRVLFNMESKRNPQLNGVPTIFEFVRDEEKRQTLQFILSSTELGYPFMTPPGVAPDRLAVLRRAFDATVRDEAFVKEAERLKLEVTPTGGADLEGLVNDLYRIPPPVVAKAKALMGEKEG